MEALFGEIIKQLIGKGRGPKKEWTERDLVRLENLFLSAGGDKNKLSLGDVSNIQLLDSIAKKYGDKIVNLSEPEFDELERESNEAARAARASARKQAQGPASHAPHSSRKDSRSYAGRTKRVAAGGAERAQGLRSDRGLLSKVATPTGVAAEFRNQVAAGLGMNKRAAKQVVAEFLGETISDKVDYRGVTFDIEVEHVADSRAWVLTFYIMGKKPVFTICRDEIPHSRPLEYVKDFDPIYWAKQYVLGGNLDAHIRYIQRGGFPWERLPEIAE